MDKLHGSQGAPLTWNRYLYSRANPLKYLDGNGLEELLFTVRTFIPAPAVKGPLGTFGGDGRSFKASGGTARTTQKVLVETDPGRRASPIISKAADIGETHLLADDGSIAKSATASSEGMKATGSRDDSGSAVIQIKGSADNPLATPSFSIDYDLQVEASPSGRSISMTGTQDGFPAIEVYVTNSSGQTTTLYQFDPASVNNGVMSLFPWAGDQSVNVTCSTDSEGRLICVSN